MFTSYKFNIQVICVSFVHRCVASCLTLSHRTGCVTYTTSYVFVPCAQVCGKLFESQDRLCDLHYKLSFCPLCTGVWQAV